mgnify:FL=1
MGLITRLQSAFREAAPAPIRMTGFPSDGGVAISLTSTTALGLSAVWRCLDILGNGVSQLAWDERRGNASLPLSRLVRRPLDACTRRDWVGYVVSSLALYDIAYLWHVGGYDNEGVPVSLWPVAPPYVTVTQTTYPIIPFVTPDEYFVGTMRVPRSKLTIIRRAPRPGMADWQAGVINLARIKFAEAMSADAYASRYWQSGGSPTTVLETEAVLNDVEATSLSDRWAQKRSRGPDHAAVLSSGLKARPMGADPTQQAAVDARKELVADIGRYFGIGSHILNAPQGDSETYKSNEAADQDLLRYTIQNYVDGIEDAISDNLPGGRTMVMDTRPLTNGPFLSRSQAYQLLTAGKAIFSVDEARSDFGLPPVEDPDELNPPSIAVPVASTDPQGVTSV